MLCTGTNKITTKSYKYKLLKWRQKKQDGRLSNELFCNKLKTTVVHVLERGAATGGFLTACAHEFLFRGYAVKFFSIRLNIQHPYRWGQETRA